MKKIVVPVDFSDTSKEATKMAVKIAKKNDAEIVLVHWYGRPYKADFSVMGGSSSAHLDIEKDEAYKKEVIEEMDNLLGLTELEGVKNKKMFIYGTDVKSIMNSELLADADLYVIGKTGTSGLQEKFLGSNAGDIVRYAKSPVLTVEKCTDFF